MANPTPLRLGLEIEAVFVPKELEALGPGGKPLEPKEFAAQLANGFSNTLGLHSVYGDDYNKYRGKKYKEWEIIHDETLREDPTNMTYPLEITSPILTFDPEGNWRHQVRKLFAHIDTKCVRMETNKSCGFHVHLSPGDGKPWTLDQLKRICFSIYYFEGALLALLPVSRRHSMFVSSRQMYNRNFFNLSTKACYQLIFEKKSIRDLVCLMQEEEDVCCSWNFRNLLGDKPGWKSTGATIEWRQPPGITTVEECLVWAEVAVTFVQAVRHWSSIGDEIHDVARGYTADVEGLRKAVFERGIPMTPGSDVRYLDTAFKGRSGQVTCDECGYDNYTEIPVEEESEEEGRIDAALLDKLRNI
ncbi:hypothetical protein CONLIGDRAFT_675289 [Coniochaeta ligniaria NRRL 30616]|uniref:Amidoligase enzyme n=1 Tax=Coniochaeta ligniaria NRRL 30616 TaxID=1408157 RepID=A0A1J7J4B8_9PEZI|nr:hypothetical protein CONLIGDRAFT_675289 [Coniochaeta ligniaria NRRL 30616]